MRNRDGQIVTFSGLLVCPFELRPEDVLIEDIAHALSNICRYTGHTSDFYSVAQHCLILSYRVPIEHAMTALLHDASEAYLVDVPSPLKPYFPNYREREAAIEQVIAERFGLPYPWPGIIKELDVEARGHEVRQLFPQGPAWERNPIPEGARPWPIWPELPKVAKTDFLERYHQLNWLATSGGSVHAGNEAR